MTDPNSEFDGIDLESAESTPLHEMVAESHELFMEMLDTGYEKRDALQIVAHILYDGMMSRFMGDIDDFDEDPDDLDEHPQ